MADAKNTPPEPKAMQSTLRLTPDQAAKISLIAQTNGTTVAHEVREAIDARIAELRLDPVFQARLRESVERNQAILDELAKK